MTWLESCRPAQFHFGLLQAVQVAEGKSPYVVAIESLGLAPYEPGVGIDRGQCFRVLMGADQHLGQREVSRNMVCG